MNLGSYQVGCILLVSTFLDNVFCILVTLSLVWFVHLRHLLGVRYWCHGDGCKVIRRSCEVAISEGYLCWRVPILDAWVGRYCHPWWDISDIVITFLRSKLICQAFSLLYFWGLIRRSDKRRIRLSFQRSSFTRAASLTFWVLRRPFLSCTTSKPHNLLFSTLSLFVLVHLFLLQHWLEEWRSCSHSKKRDKMKRIKRKNKFTQ